MHYINPRTHSLIHKLSTVIVATVRIASKHRSFYRIRLVASMCTHHLMRRSMGSYQSISKGHLDRFSRCCEAHDRDQQTDTSTTLLHLYEAAAFTLCMRCGLTVAKDLFMDRRDSEMTYSVSSGT